MYFKTKNVTISSAQIVFTLQNTNMQTFYDLLVFKVYFNCCKIEGHHLPPQMKNDPSVNGVASFSKVRGMDVVCLLKIKTMNTMTEGYKGITYKI